MKPVQLRPTWPESRYSHQTCFRSSAIFDQRADAPAFFNARSKQLRRHDLLLDELFHRRHASAARLERTLAIDDIAAQSVLVVTHPMTARDFGGHPQAIVVGDD